MHKTQRPLGEQMFLTILIFRVMKPTLFTTVIIVFISLSLQARTKNVEPSTTGFGTYETYELKEGPVALKNSIGEYVILYSGLSAPIYVSVVKEKNCKLYLVRTWGYELQYICDGKEFGVQFMNKDYAKISYKEMRYKINEDAFIQQCEFTTPPKSDRKRIQLIASCLPRILA